MSVPYASIVPEVWAGMECTLNRVENRYVDQFIKSGHRDRLSDLKLFSGLGLKKIRCPFLWEVLAAVSLDAPNWSSSDRSLSAFEDCGLVPIAGLLHHGSGPSYTSLLDPEFPEKFANFASQFSARYPWITDYSLINEPLTTARFSAEAA